MNITYRNPYLEEVAGALKKLITISISYPVSGDFRTIRNKSKTPTKEQLRPSFNVINHMSPIMKPGKMQTQQIFAKTNPFEYSFAKTNDFGVRQLRDERSPGK